MAKSGPRELAAFHEQVLQNERRRGKMPPITEAAEAPAQAAAPAPTRKRAPRSDAGKKRAAPAPGTVVLKLEMSSDEANELLGHFVRTGKTQSAHQIVDAIAKAQKPAA